MPLVQCNHCQQTLNAPNDLAGKRVRCPKCQNALVVPISEQATPAPQSNQPTQPAAGGLFGDDPAAGQSPMPQNQMAPNPMGQGNVANQPAMQSGYAQPTRSSSSNPYEKVNTGIKLVLLSLMISFASMILGMLLSFLSGELNDISSILGKLNRLVGLAGSGLGIAGLIFCLYVPEKTGARPLAIAALGCIAAKAIIVEIIVTLVGLLGTSFAGLMMMGMTLAMLLPLATAILFLLFLRKVTEYKNMPREVEELDILFKLMFFILIGGMAGQFILPLIPFGSYLLVLAMAAAEVYWVIRLATLLNTLEFHRS